MDNNISKSFENNEENKIIPFVDENGNKIDLELIDAFEFNGNEYVALLPPDEGEEETEVMLMRIEKEEDNDVLVYIEDDDELDNAFEIFKDRMSDEFDFLE